MTFAGRLAVAVTALTLVAPSGCTLGSGEADIEPAATIDPRESAPQDPALRDELVAMLDEDQAERTGDSAVWNDRARADRLATITSDRGWPTFSLVGENGATAAWAIAQHADHDVAFQEQMLELMRSAVDDGEADASQLAFLVDRVAVNRGRPQQYGSQAGCVDGRAEAGDIEKPDEVDELRALVGLPPLADYLAEFSQLCAADQ